MTDLVEVRRCRTQAEAEQFALVLAAIGIDGFLLPDRGCVVLYVALPDAEYARRQLDAFERENPIEWQPSPSPAPASNFDFGASMAYAIVLLFVFGAQRRTTWSIDWLAAGAVQVGLIREGAWWRTVTALTLHADHAHLLVNLAAGILLGPLVAQLLGNGLGWLAILLAGALGNGLNALLHADEHTAVGASTALFGALGLLSGHGRRSRVVPWRGGIRRWAPLGAGIMLLAYLGFGGERTDVGAHVAGFLVGGVLGFVLAHCANLVPQGPVAQRFYGITACALLAVAWLFATHHQGGG